MPHHFIDLGLITLIAALAAVLLVWLKQLPMVGYVAAGALLGPSVLNIIESEEQIRIVAELGVILLLFILGMELPLKSFRESYKPALVVSLGLVALSLGMTFLIGLAIDLTLAEKITYGFIISLSSTAVAIKLLESVNLKDKGTGQVAISVLIAQDIIFVPMILILNAMGTAQSGGAGGVDLSFIPKIAGALALLAALVWYLTRKETVRLPFHGIIDQQPELIAVAAIALCLIAAGLSEIAGLSPAFGAFIAGLVAGNSTSRDRILHRIEPMQNVLIMVFFLSIGMLLDFAVIADNLALVGLLLLGSMVFKTISSIALLKASLPADRWRCSFVSGLTISQIGEFSFILAAAALGHGILSPDSYKIALAVIALSLVFSPLWTAILSRFVDIAYRQRASDCITSTLGKIFERPADVRS